MRVTAAIFWLKTRGQWKESVPEFAGLGPKLVISWHGPTGEIEPGMLPPPAKPLGGTLLAKPPAD